MRTMGNLKVALTAVLLSLGNFAAANNDAYINLTSCQVPQQSSQTTCDIQVTWQGYSTIGGGGGGDPAQNTPSTVEAPCLRHNSQQVACLESGTRTRTVSVGHQFFTLVSSGLNSTVQAAEAVIIGYAPYTKPFSWTTSTHNEIAGDFDGNGKNDILVQPKLKSSQTGLFPQTETDLYVSGFHQAWTTIHPQISSIEDWSEESYKAIAGNFNSNPGSELLLLGHKEIILLHGDVITPITIFPQVNNAIVSWDSNGNASYSEFEFDANPADFEIIVGDLSGDGYDEIFLQGKSKGSTSYILSNTGSLVQTLSNGYLNIDWSASAYSASILGGQIHLTALSSTNDSNSTNHNSSGAVSSLQNPVTKPSVFGNPQLYVYKGSNYDFTPSTVSEASLSFSISGMPNWMSLNSSTGRIYGSTTNSTGNENYNVSLTATENKSHTIPATLSFNLAVLEAFSIGEREYDIYKVSNGDLYLVAKDGSGYFKINQESGQTWLEKISQAEFNSASAQLDSRYKVLYRDIDSDGSLDLVIYDQNFNENSYAITSVYSTSHTTQVGLPHEFVIPDAAIETISVPEQQAIGAVEGSAGVSGGSASYHIPIAVPPGRNGMEPQVSLSYSSTGGNGVVGVGWSLGASSSIHRCAANQAQDGFTSSPQYDDVRDRLCLDGQKLIKTSTGEYGEDNATYKTEFDNFGTVTQYGEINGSSTYFKLVNQDGKVSLFGDTTDSFQKAGGKSAAMTWAISKVEDLFGNNIVYQYNVHGEGEYTLKQITYTGFNGAEGDRHVLFEYADRNDTTEKTDYRTSYLAGGKTRLTQRLSVIKTKYDDADIRKYNLNYGTNSLSSGRTLLRSIEECGYRDGWTCLPKTSFEWQEAAPKYVLEPVEFDNNGTTVAANVASKIDWVVPKADIDGDGVRDWPGLDTNNDFIADVAGFMVNAEGEVTATHNSTADGCYSRANLKFGKRCLTVDFNQDGKTDFFKLENSTSGALNIKLNGGSTWVNTPFSLEYYQDSLINISDYTGDGWPDIIVQLADSQWAQPKVYVYPHTKNNAQPYTTASRIFLFQLSENNPSVLFEYAEQIQAIGDMDGNGIQDLLVSLLPRPDDNQPGMPYPDRLILLKNSTSGELLFDEYQFTGHLVPQTSLNLGDAHFFHDINGDGLADWLSMNSENSKYWLEAKLNTGGAFTGDWIDLAVNVPVRTQFYYPTSGETEVYVFPVIEKTMSMDYNGDGRPELLFADDVVASACSLVFHYPPGSVNRVEEYMCDDELWGSTYFMQSSNRRSPIDGHRKDVSARNFKAIYFDEALDGTISTRVEATDIVAASVERIAIDATGNGLTDVVTTFECQIEGCAWNEDAQEHGGQVTNSSLVSNRLYINRNIGASSSNDGYEAIDVLKSVTQGLGVKDEWTYRPLGSDEFDTTNGAFYDPDHAYVRGDVQSGDQEHFHFGSSMMVVAEHRTSNGLSNGMNATQYKYRGAVFNNQGRGFQGFRTIIVDSPTKVDSSGGLEYTRSVTDFHQKFPKAGKVEAIRTCKASNDDEYCDGDKLSSRTVTYHEKTTVSDSLYWIVANDDTSITYPLTGGTKELSRSETSIAYTDLDIYGNISKVVSQINNGFSTVKTTKEFDFDTTDASWRNKLNYNTVQYETVTGSAVHETSLDPIKKVKTSYTWTSERLPDLVTTEPLLPANDSGKKVVVDTDYNDYGLPTEVSTYESGNLDDARKVSTNYSNDGSSVAADGYFVYEVTNAKDHKIKTTSDPHNGQALSVTQNGLTSWTDFDVFGRAEEITPPTDTGQPTHIRFANCNNGCDGINDSSIRYKTTSYQVGAPTTVAYKDKLNRVIYSKLEKFDGTASYNKVIYNRLGQKTFESVPSSATDETKGVSFDAYDLLGRLTSKTVSQPYDQSMIVAYSYVDNTTNIEVTGLEKTLTMSRTYGSDGKLIKTTQNDGVQDIVTQYAYDAMSNPIVLQDANGNAIRAKYNAMGQKDYVDDPNMGTKSFTYTEFGEVLSETDANSDTYYFVYDDLGRLTYRYLNLLPSDTNQDMAEASFYYDAQCDGALDSETRLDLTGSESFSKTYSYDAWCRPSDVTTNIDGTDFKTSTVYDGNYGRVKGVLYPNKLLAETLYNSRGYATKTQNPLTNYVYHEVTSMDARGQVLTANKANGFLNEGFEYWDETGQMKLVYAQTTNGASQRHRIEYVYDSFGNLKTQTTESMRSSLVSSIETYTYDKLHRLTKSARTVNGVSLNDINYDYDKVGNIKFKDDYANNYLYGDASKSSGNAGPNAIYSINKIGDGTKTFAYDNNGNLKSGDSKLINYNAFNKPVSISRNGITSRFYYGADQMRYKQIKEGRSYGDEVTLYIDKIFEVISYKGETQKKLYLGDTLITETSSGGQTVQKMSFVHRDRLGSVVTITDENGDVVDKKSFDPFGKPRKGTMEDVDPPTLIDVAYADGFISTLDDFKLETRRGFTDHEHLDDAQLIHMNGRVYDYQLGRFLSVDPFIQFIGNSQGINPYSYILNNPLAGTDPTGYNVQIGHQITTWLMTPSEGKREFAETLVLGAEMMHPHTTRDHILELAGSDSLEDKIQLFAEVAAATYTLGGTIVPSPGDVKKAVNKSIDRKLSQSTSKNTKVATKNGGNSSMKKSEPASLGARGDNETGYDLNYGKDRMHESPTKMRNPQGTANPKHKTEPSFKDPKTLKEESILREFTNNPKPGALEGARYKDIGEARLDGFKGEGWRKMTMRKDGVEIHYLQNSETGRVDDIKFTHGRDKVKKAADTEKRSSGEPPEWWTHGKD